MGKGMKIIKKLMIGMLAVLVLAGTAVTLFYVFGESGETAPERSPRISEAEPISTGNVFEAETDKAAWLASMPPAGSGGVWQFFPSIPFAAEPGDTVTLSVPALGFLAWESDSGLADIEFTDERIEADRAIASFVKPEGLFLVWASYEYVSQESEGIMLINPDRFEDGAVQLNTNNVANWPTATNPLRLAYGMFNNSYIDVINFIGLESDATITTHNFFAMTGGSDQPNHPSSAGAGAAFHGLIYRLSSPTGENRSFTMQTPLTPDPDFNSDNPDGYAMQRSFIGPRFFPQGMIDADPPLGFMPTVVVTFNFSINIAWPDRYNEVSIPVLENGQPVYIDDIQQFHPPGTVLERAGGSINVPIEFVVLPQPNIFRENNRPLPLGMDGVYYGHRQTAPGVWITDGHDTRVNVVIVDSASPNFPRPIPNPGTPPAIGEIFWAFTIRTYAGDGRGGGVDIRFPTPARVENNANPELDLVLSNRPTTTAQIGTVGDITGPITFGVGENQRFVIRLSAFMRHPNADILEQEIGFTEQYFELTILPRPRFGLMDGETAVFGLDALTHMMADQTSADNEPDESTTVTRDTIVAAGLPARPDGGYTNWTFSWDYSEPWTTPPTSTAAGIPGPQLPAPDPITGRSDFTNSLPPGLSFRGRAPGWNGYVDNIMLGRAAFDLIGVPPAGTFGRFIIGFEVDSFRETDNLNIQTAERAEFELIIWPRTYLNASTRPTVGAHIRRVDSAGEPEQTIAFIEGANFLQWENRRAVIPGTMGIVSIPSTEFIRWEHNRFMTQPSNIPSIGGPVGDNVVASLDPNGLPIYNQLPGQQGHTQFTGHARTASHNLMTMRMPAPWDSHNGFYNPYAPPANVYIEGIVSTNPPRIVFDGLPGRVELPEGRSVRIENAGDSGDNRDFRWEMFPSLQPEASFAGLSPTLLQSNNFLSVLQIAPTVASPPNEPYQFTVSVFLQGGMRMDFPLELLILGRPGAGDINLDGRIDYWDLLLLARHFEGEPLTGQSYENARDIIPGSTSVGLGHLTTFRRIFGIREVNVPS
ncbi:MAG: hypothetical protein FWB92_07715 [Oscillospiraceae bacterium]|nr:hypothetical protein [Oscillospiraceae bacterium]